MNRGVQSVVEKLNEETFIERIKEAVFALFFSYPFKFMSQIVEIKVQEAFFLNEIAEHQAIEHNGSVPMLVFVFLVCYVIIDARNKLDKSRVFFLESGIKIFSDFFGVHCESTLHLRAEVNDSCIFANVERKALDFGVKQISLFSGFIFNENEVSLLVGFHRHNPKVMFGAAKLENCDIVVGLTAKFSVNLLADAIRGNGIDRASKNLKAVAFRYCCETVIYFIDSYCRKLSLTAKAVPAEFRNEKFTERAFGNKG